MNKKLFIGFVSTTMVVVLGSCGTFPQDKVENANKAFNDARAAEADVYLPAEFVALQNSMNSAMAELEIQQKKLFKRYNAVKVSLEEASSFANRVAGNASIVKEGFIEKSVWLLNETKAISEENNILVTKLTEGKVRTSTIEQIKADMSSNTAAVKEAQYAFDKEAFMDALNRIEAAKAKADSINTKIKEALKITSVKF